MIAVVLRYQKDLGKAYVMDYLTKVGVDMATVTVQGTKAVAFVNGPVLYDKKIEVYYLTDKPSVCVRATDIDYLLAQENDLESLRGGV